ncbi:MAG: hypothetical protein M1825_003452 [Sarcosagium campestre]|nr:MAG: hypothetical protein M1825_003452 [Sarcosagium campestre]
MDILSRNPGIVVFSGGSAANSLVDVFDAVVANKQCPLSYVIPTSDNGGSSSEIIRVFGGPGIGDIRSRLVRLIPTEPSTPERRAIHNLFNHRLPPSGQEARLEWLEIIESRSTLWTDISLPKRELIRAYLSLLNLEIVKRTRPPYNTFNFQSAAVGNLFLTGARLFSGSFEAAIYLLGSLTGVPDRTAVLPIIKSEFTHHIAAGLRDGSLVVGQNAISHPSTPTALPSTGDPATIPPDESDLDIATSSWQPAHEKGDRLPDDHDDEMEVEDATLPGSLATLRRPNISFTKDPAAAAERPLPARIDRVWYISPFGQEMRPAANPRVLAAIQAATSIIYSIGSLYTSIVPCLIPRGIGRALADTRIRRKILVLNGSLDRETAGFNAIDFVEAIAAAAQGIGSGESPTPVAGVAERNDAETEQSPRGFVHPERWKLYITHLVYLEGERVPFVDAAALRRLGIDCVKVYGRKADDGGMRYDGKALAQALEVITGGLEKGRRMTIEA